MGKGKRRGGEQKVLWDLSEKDEKVEASKEQSPYITNRETRGFKRMNIWKQGATISYVRGLLLALHSGITPGELMGPYKDAGFKSRLATLQGKFPTAVQI